MTGNQNGDRLILFLIWFWWLVPPIALLIFAAGVILAAICTFLFIIGLFKPLVVCGCDFDREDAYIYFRDSFTVAFAIPVVVYACELVYRVRIDASIYQYAFLIGYVVGGFGARVWDWFYSKFIYVSRSYSAPQTTTPAAQGKQELLPPPSSSYRYASWDDEEAQR